MTTKTNAAAIYGVKAKIISIEVSINSGIGFHIVGLPDNAIRESQIRISPALNNMKYVIPRQNIIVNLAPADIKKEGAMYDLPIALCILNESSQCKLIGLEKHLILGELSLNGFLEPIKGAISIALSALEAGIKTFILPEKNAQEAAVVDGINIIPIKHISEAIDFLSGKKEIKPIKVDAQKLIKEQKKQYSLDFSDVQGQNNVKRSLEIAAAGGHNLIMIGPPGAGKTMLAKRIPTILPPLTLNEAIETTIIYSVKKELKDGEIVTSRPFRSPHHSISSIALVGGGTDPKPGEISLAHNGVLFLDELPEFKRDVLEIMRQPLEERHVTISRANMSTDFPSNFMLIASMNPCPCGYYNHPTKACVCKNGVVQKYLNKISGPLLDRIDLHIQVTPISYDAISTNIKTESSLSIQSRVIEARKRQTYRLQKYNNIYTNAMMSSNMVKSICEISNTSKKLIKDAMERLGLSARAYSRILKVSRTIADLDNSENIKEIHVAEAIHYRSLDRNNWGY